MAGFNLPGILANTNPNALAEAQAEKVIFLNVEDVLPNPMNMYSTVGAEELMNNIADNGLKEPLQVINKSEGYVLLSGHTRLEACKLLLKEGYRYSFHGRDISGKVPVMVLPPFDDESEEELAIMATNYQRIMTNKDRDNLIDHCEEILNRQTEQGIREKGRTAHIIATMIHIPEFYIKNYLAKKHAENAEVDDEALLQEKKKSYKKICMQMRRLSNSISEYDWEDPDIDLQTAIELSESLKILIDERIGNAHE